MPRAIRTDEELRADSAHVLYEAQALDGAVRLLAADQISSAKLPREAVNALLESLAIHARALIGFLYADPESARPDDVLAIDYIPDWSLRPSDLSPFLRDVKRRADKEIAHITRHRTEVGLGEAPTEPGVGLAEDVRMWKYGKVHTEVADTFKVFIKWVPEDKVRPGWRDDAWASLPEFARGRREDFHHPPDYPGRRTVAGTADIPNRPEQPW